MSRQNVLNSIPNLRWDVLINNVLIKKVCILSKTLGSMRHNMLKWLMIYILNKLTSYLYEGELCFKVIERIYNMATNENVWTLIWLSQTKNVCKSIENWIAKLGKTWWGYYEIFCILANYYFLVPIFQPIINFLTFINPIWLTIPRGLWPKKNCQIFSFEGAQI